MLIGLGSATRATGGAELRHAARRPVSEQQTPAVVRRLNRGARLVLLLAAVLTAICTLVAGPVGAAHAVSATPSALAAATSNTASGGADPAAETRVGASTVAAVTFVGAGSGIAAGQRRDSTLPQPGFASATSVAAEEGGLGARGLRAVCNCFPAGTKVATQRGETPIEKIKVGDRVWAQDLTSGKRELRKVVGLFNKHTDELMTLTVAGATIDVTSKHPFYVPGRGWVMSGQLKIGDKLLQRNGTVVAITALTHRSADTTVYNFEVEGDHNYYTSEAHLLVHNCDIGETVASHIGEGSTA